VVRRGETGISINELRALSAVIAAAHGGRAAKRLAMTVHGAKNQEFDRVVVLWPYGIKKDPLFQRKLLYNAVTRAKREAVILVQGGDARIAKDSTLQLLRG